MRNITLSLYLAVIFISGCSKQNTRFQSNSGNSQSGDGWTVPLNQLLISQLPADRIKSIDNPYFQTISKNNLNVNEKVYVYRYGDTVKIYPESILGGHEIVNDRIGNHYYAVTYCPLTGSAIAWNRDINDKVSEFGVSGHLYNENLIPYDRNGKSYWSQMILQSIKGNSAGEDLESETLLLALGATVAKSFPKALVLVDTSENICNDSICIPLKQSKNQGDPVDNNVVIPNGDFFGFVNTNITVGGKAAMLFNYDMFADSVSTYNTNFSNLKVIVVGSKTLQFIVGFIDDTGNPESVFSPVQNSLPIILSDNFGNKYDITGLVVDGPLKGKRLGSSTSYTAHGFAWASFFGSGIKIFEK